MNLAPWKYRNILASDGGPVKEIKYFKVESPYLNSVFEAFASIDPKVMVNHIVKENSIYGTMDGSGTAALQIDAKYKAISEALERWAFYDSYNGKNAKPYGYDVDCSTTGMAGYPGFTAAQARENSFNEAVERWSLCSWWEGFLPSTVLSSKTLWQGIEINSPFENNKVVLLWAKIQNTEHYCYSFSCGRTLEHAAKRALVELDRNRRGIDTYLATPVKVVDVPEQRLLYFASQEGHEVFQKRVAQSKELKTIPPKPPLVVDTEIVGPWSKYCRVWRCLFEPRSTSALGDDIHYFFF